MITSFSHRLWNSVSRLRKVPRSRSPYDQVPYTGSPLPNPTSPVNTLSKRQANRTLRDSQSIDVQGCHLAFADVGRLVGNWRSLGWLFRGDLGNGEPRAVFKSFRPFCGSRGNARLKLALPCEHHYSSRSPFAGKQWQTSAIRALVKRVPEFVANANGGSEFQHATVRGIKRSIQMDCTGSFIKTLRLDAKSARGVAHKDDPAERSTLPFMRRNSRHMPRLNNLVTHKSQIGRSLTERVVNPFPIGSTWSPKFSVVSSNLGADSILLVAGRVTTPESSQSNAGRVIEPQSERSTERRPSAATSRHVSFRERLNRTAAAIDATTHVASCIAANTGSQSSQTLSPSDFSGDGSTPGKTVASTSVTPGGSGSGSDVIVPSADNEQISRSDEPTPNDFEKKRAARMNARPRRMLPRIR